MVKIDVIPVGMFLSNCIIASCEETSEGVIIDAGDESERIISAVENSGVHVKAVISTHGHIDHVSALSEVVTALDVPAYMHADEIPIYEKVEASAAMFGLPAPERVNIDKYLDDGERIQFGNITAEVIHAPGHSPGSICVAFRGATPPCVVSGDVLFKGSIGRTDLAGGSLQGIMHTLKTIFVPMPNETVVYPGHGPETTIGEEKLTNPFLAPLARDGY